MPFELDLFVNAVREKAFAVGISAANGCGSVRLNPQDFVEVWALQTSGATQLLTNDAVGDWLTIQQEPGEVAVRGTPQFAVPASVFTKVPYATVAYDDHSEFDPATSQFSPSQAGDYEFCASLSSTTEFELDLYKNDVRERALALGTTGIATGCRVIRLVASDHVAVWMYQQSVASVTIPPDPFWNWLDVHRVSADVSIGGAASFSLPPTTFVTIPYATELYDDNNRFNPATHQYTVGSTGDYELCASLIQPNSPDLMEIVLVKSGIRDKLLSRRATAPGGCRVMRLNGGDELEAQIYSSATSSTTIDTSVVWNWLTVRSIQ